MLVKEKNNQLAQYVHNIDYLLNTSRTNLNQINDILSLWNPQKMNQLYSSTSEMMQKSNSILDKLDIVVNNLLNGSSLTFNVNTDSQQIVDDFEPNSIQDSSEITSSPITEIPNIDNLNN